MSVEFIRKHENPVGFFINYIDDGKEYWHLSFKDCDYHKDGKHPVNRKHELFKMSGQPLEEN